MNFRKLPQQQQGGFQMAPMIDIMFLLLIFFMIASVAVERETALGITVPTAESGVSKARETGEIIINIDKDGNYIINNAKMDVNRLQSLLARVSQAYENQPVIIRAAGDTKHEAVVEVLDVCRKVDIWNVSFAALPKKQ